MLVQYLLSELLVALACDHAPDGGACSDAHVCESSVHVTTRLDRTERSRSRPNSVGTRDLRVHQPVRTPRSPHRTDPSQPETVESTRSIRTGSIEKVRGSHFSRPRAKASVSSPSSVIWPGASRCWPGRVRALIDESCTKKRTRGYLRQALALHAVQRHECLKRVCEHQGEHSAP